MTPRQWVFFLDSVPFTAAAIRGETSLGGSESAALGMMRALAARGHDVQCFATKLDAPGDYDGVSWHRAESDLGPALGFLTPDVFVSLRMPTPFVHYRVQAGLCVLWNEDLLVDPAVTGTLSQVDECWYVSQYHRAQWIGREPMLEPMSWVTKNGIDPRLYPATVTPTTATWADGTVVRREPHRYLYISRPERALKPLLEMWPAIRQADPQAVLGICRYRSMYDGEGTNVQQMVDRFDAITEAVNRQVGGIEWLGQLSKRPLAEAIARSRAMLYPGVAEFAETSCIAALEAQACGTPLLASWRGALPETLHPDAGILIDGDPETPAYRAAYLRAVQQIAGLPEDAYGARQAAGRAHVAGYAFDTLAAEWDAHVEDVFARRVQAQPAKVLQALLHWDRHVMARQLARTLPDAPLEVPVDGCATPAAVIALCDTVIRGEDQTAEDYATHAAADPVAESKTNERFAELITAAQQAGATAPRAILDVACGNGSLALALANAFPEAHVRGVDYSQGVLRLAEAGAATVGVADRVTFSQAEWTQLPEGPFDLVTCGEFLEHVEAPEALINALEARCAPDGVCVLTTPCGPFSELLEDMAHRKRGHLHAFTHQQLNRLFAGRTWSLSHFAIGQSQRGVPMGYWIVTWRPQVSQPVQPVDWTGDLLATRPYQSVWGMLIVKDAERWIVNCLQSIRGTLDGILVHDTGSTDATRHLVESYGGTLVATDWPGSFCVARNRVLAEVEARGADWVLWIDADEQLEHGERLRRYTTGAGPFLGYVLRQQHLMLDAPQFHDKPVRLFRAGAGIRFFGAIHEQPETAPDAGVWPCLELPDVDVLHFGYHRDQARRRKLLTRNLPLLKQQLAAPVGERRRLDLVLFIRDCQNIAQFELEAARTLTPKARQHAEAGVAAYQTHFADPGDKYHQLARPFYEGCLHLLGQGVEIKWGFGAGMPKVSGKLTPESFRAASVEEARTEVTARMNSILAPLTVPALDTRPCVRRTGHGQPE